MSFADGTGCMLFMQDEYLEVEHLRNLREVLIEEAMVKTCEPGPETVAIENVQERMRRLLQ